MHNDRNVFAKNEIFNISGLGDIFKRLRESYKNDTMMLNTKTFY